MLNLAAAQDYDAFFEQEIAYRKLGLYPPFCGLCVVGFSGPKEIEVARAAARFWLGDSAPPVAYSCSHGSVGKNFKKVEKNLEKVLFFSGCGVQYVI